MKAERSHNFESIFTTPGDRLQFFVVHFLKGKSLNESIMNRSKKERIQFDFFTARVRSFRYILIFYLR